MTQNQPNTPSRGEDIIAGRNAVSEALKAGRTIDTLYITRGNHSGPLSVLIAKAKKKFRLILRTWKILSEIRPPSANAY